MKFRTDKKASPAKVIKSGVVSGHTYTLTSQYFITIYGNDIYEAEHTKSKGKQA